MTFQTCAHQDQESSLGRNLNMPCGVNSSVKLHILFLRSG